jgi:hypothetical protein
MINTSAGAPTPPTDDTLAAISDIADQLCSTLNDDFDLCVEVDTDDEHVLKLVIMVNFLLDRVRRYLSIWQPCRPSILKGVFSLRSSRRCARALDQTPNGLCWQPRNTSR